MVFVDFNDKDESGKAGSCICNNEGNLIDNRGTDYDIRDKVKSDYGHIVKQKIKNDSNSCGCKPGPYDVEYIKDLPEDSVKASLGCENPIAFAGIKKGDVVLDLGSGGGIDVFIASKFVGPEGKVYGLDMTDEMIELALKNKEKMNAKNVEFIKGYIEDIPLPDESVDVIISNCVINLSPDKEKTMREIYRVLKPGGRIAIGDMVAQNEIPHEFKEFLKSIWSGCIGGALSIGEFSSILENAGFKEINISPVENSYLNPQVIKIKKSEIMGDTMGIEMSEEQLERFYEFLERISTEKVYLSARIMAVK